jgi:HlyD family secretion protein
MQVYAATDESDVGMIHPGQEVSFKVDAYPRDTFTGKVSQVRMNATTVQNVVTYNTIIDFANPQLKLFPGMTAYITLPVASASEVLRVPNGALRFKPDMPAEEIRALYQKYGLTSGQHAPASGAADSSTRTVSPSGAGEGQRGGGAAGEQRTPRVDVSVVWKLLPDKSLQPVKIRTGITDHTVTEVAQVLNGELGANDEVVTGSQALTSAPSAAPGMGGGARRR